MNISLSRRALLRHTGTLVVLIITPACDFTEGAPSSSLHALNDRIEVNRDGSVQLHLGRIEMGQGLYAAMIQLAAEELDLDMVRIRVAPIDTASSPDEGFTDSSISMRGTGMAVRRAAADARAMLLALAANQWGVSAASLHVADGTVQAQDGRRTNYWQLLAGARVLPVVRGSLKRPEEYRLLGHSIPRPDIPARVNGAPAFLQDLRLPGMLHARVLRPPSHGASLQHVELAAARAYPGVRQVVHNGNFLAVVAQREELAIAALEVLRTSCRWHESATLPESQDLYVHLRREAGLPETRISPSPGKQQLTATYEVPYRMHGSIGPSCAVAHFNDGRLTIWTHSQGVFPLRSSLAGLMDMSPRAIRCIHREGAGCYGHNGADDAAADAALIARALPGVPVRVQWSREDEHGWEPYGPAMVMRLTGAIDTHGRITRWRHVVASPTHSSRPGGAQRLLAARHLDPPIAASFLDGLTTWTGGGRYNAKPYYRVPAEVDSLLVRRPPLRSSALRSLGAYANVFAIESFMDELAEQAGADPLEFRLAHLDDIRAIEVVRLAAQHFGWQQDRTQPQGIGFARLNGYGAYVAVCAQAAVGPDGRSRIIRIVAAADCGELVNPDAVRNQIEGGIVQAASWTLYEQVRFDRTRVTSVDWSSYPILRITEAPSVEVHLIDRPRQDYLGLGEAAQGPAGAAVANAVARLRGYRNRTLPLNVADNR